MRRLPARSYLAYGAVAGLTLMLVGLAVMQYRWSVQISEAERDRMKNGLQVSGVQFRREFARELVNVFTALQVDPTVPAADDFDQYAKNTAQALRGSSDPDLVLDVFIWQTPATGPPGVLQLNRETERFASISTPATLEPFLSRLSLASHEPDRFTGFRPMGWTFEGGLPALVRSLISFPDQDERGGPHPEPLLRGYVIVLLNRDYLQHKLLPDLAARHFAGAQGLEYQVAVYRENDPDHPFYESAQWLSSKTLGAIDFSIDLFDIRQGPGERRDGGLGGPDRQSPRGSGFGMAEGRDPGRLQGRGPTRTEFGGPMGGGPRRPWLQGGPGRMRRPGGPTAPVMLAADKGGPWKLAVKHKSGSVEVAVAALRFRNLAVSFGILLVLAGGMATIIVFTQRAQRLARLQMEFVAGMSHELRTPLAVICSASDNLVDGVVEGKSQVKLYGSVIRNEARRLAGMVEQTLLFASGQRARPAGAVPLEVPDLIDSALAALGPSISESGAHIEKHIESELPQLTADPASLTQCLQNLIANAIKYGGTERWVGIKASPSPGGIRITVEDHGLGIDPDDMPHIFDPFFRGKAALDAQIHGTGLGLNLAKGFAEAAGGSISVTSTVGQGTRFVVQLPVSTPVRQIA